MKIGLKIKPKDEMYLFIYDKNQIYIPSVARIYGSDFRKISDVSSHYRIHMEKVYDFYTS